MKKVLTAEQMREVDRLTTERYGIPSIILMENAAHAVARVITEKLGGSVKDRRILIVCGTGNNGGDGVALARILFSQGASCFVDLIGSISDVKGDARVNFEIANAVNDGCDLDPNKNCLILSQISDENQGHFFLDWSNQHMCVLVDALFGTGLTRPLEGPFVEIAKAIVRARRRGDFETVFAIDMPSGLDSNLAEPIGRHAAADVTITFTSPKPANVLTPAANSNGELIVANIGSPRELIDEQPSQLYLAEQSDAVRWLANAAFSTDSYKNKRGHALVIAGSEDYSGAAVLAGNAAMRSGVGLVTLAVPSAIRGEVAARALPDLILRSFDGSELDVRADATLIGCGLDANDAANEAMFLKVVEELTSPVIVDAGALAFAPTRADKSVGAPLILTPHEGEFLRLLGTDDKNVIKDRVAAVRDYATANNVILVLKGERVLIGAPDGRVVVNPTGNSGLGKAGNGDTLAGILAGFVAQAAKMEIDIFETVVAAVYIAGMAGDVAEKKYGKRVMTASDVRECLVDVFAELKDG